MLKPKDPNTVFSGVKVGRVPVEVLESFGELMACMNEQIGLHLQDPDAYPLTDDFRMAVVHMMMTGTVLVNNMYPKIEEEK